MKNYIKTIIVYFARILLRLGYIFSVQKNRILFSSYEGLQYTCNPKYIFQETFEKFGDFYEYIWVLNNPNNLPDKYRGKIKIVKYLSLKHIYYLLTSGFIINNVGIEPIIPKRKSQTFINTWHAGGAYKRVSLDMNMFSKSEKFYMRHMRNIRKKGIDIFLSSCKKFTEIASRDFDIDVEKFIPSGLPRNDRFFNVDEAKWATLRKFITTKYKIPENNLLVLYAPTFRGSPRKQVAIDNIVCSFKVADVLREKFGKPVSFLFRSHISKENKDIQNSDSMVHVVNLTEYPDMQDLLYIADVLITDYSSSIWDYSIMKKPAFLYTPDLKEYLEDRGFYTPIDTWPYPFSETIDGLCETILTYSEKDSLVKIATHQKALGSYEKGKAIVYILNVLYKQLYISM